MPRKPAQGPASPDPQPGAQDQGPPDPQPRAPVDGWEAQVLEHTTYEPNEVRLVRCGSFAIDGGALALYRGGVPNPTVEMPFAVYAPDRWRRVSLLEE